MLVSFFLMATQPDTDKASGSLTTPSGRQQRKKTPGLHIWSVFVVQLSGDLQQPPPARRWLFLPLSSHGGWEWAEREDRGRRGGREGRKEAAEQPGPRPDPHRMCHTGSPKRCFFFFAGLRGVSLRRSSSTSDSSISSSAEIRT